MYDIITFLCYIYTIVKISGENLNLEDRASIQNDMYFCDMEGVTRESEERIYL